MVLIPHSLLTNKRKEYCPTGYFFLTNITYKIDIVFANLFDDNSFKDEYEFYHKVIQHYREQFQDIHVTDAYDISGRKLENALAIYVKKKPRKFKANRIRKYMNMRLR